MQEKQHQSSSSSSIFYLAANNPGQQQLKLGPSSLPENWCIEEENDGRGRLREREDEGGKVVGRTKFSWEG